MTDRPHYRGPITDSRRWDRIALRRDDVIVVTPAKSGTTWMQTIVALLFSGDPLVAPELSVNMPWIDNQFRDIDEVAARMEAMTQRRCMKSHAPLDGLPLQESVQYICVFRHPLDVHFSFRGHIRNLPFGLFDDWYTPGASSADWFAAFLDGTEAGHDCDATPLRHILRHYAAARALADRPNVALFHYADMTRDLAGTFARLAGLLDLQHPPDVMARLVQAASFDNMRAHAARYAPGGGQGFFKSDTDFFNSGSHGQWQGQVGLADLAAYDVIMDAHLSPDARHWLENGGGPV